METGHVVNDVPQDNKGSVDDIVIPPETFADSGFKPETIGYDKLTLRRRVGRLARPGGQVADCAKLHAQPEGRRRFLDQGPVRQPPLPDRDERPRSGLEGVADADP